MSVEQLEQQIQRLPLSELVRLAEWFNGFLASRTPADAAAEPEWQEPPQLVAELEHCLAEFRANPAIAAPFEPDYFENLKRQLFLGLSFNDAANQLTGDPAVVSVDSQCRFRCRAAACDFGH